MTVDFDFLSLERVLFFNGQRLTAEDLTAAQNVNREMRWLHNRSLHQWGVGAGMAVIGEKGAREVVVAPGYALDALGREIVLAEARTLAVPPLAGVNGQPVMRDLTISYPSDAEVEIAETREGICLPRGAIRLAEVPQIHWLETAEVKTGYDIVLARAAIRNCELDAPLSLTQRRNARPPQQPKIVCGQTLEARTVWQPWTETIKKRTETAEEDVTITLGFQTNVDTTVAGFRTTPFYFARIAGNRLAGGTGRLPATFLVEGFLQVINVRPDGFTLRVLMMPQDETVGDVIKLNPPELFDPNFAGEAVAALQQVWHIVWIGAEG
jgi:hypothetical protein